MRRTGLPGRQRGAALLLVLWLAVLLAGVVMAFAWSARVEALHARGGVAAWQGGEIARAGLEYGLHRLLAGPGDAGVPDSGPWQPDGRPHAWRFAGVPVEVRLQAESGKVDLNRADPPLLSALLVAAAGLPPERADRLAAAIADWRDADDLPHPGGAERADYAAAGRDDGPANAPFATPGELRRVLGMDDAVHQALAPLVTVWSDRDRPEPALAPAPVLRALGLDPAPWLAARTGEAGGGAPLVLASVGDVFSIDSTALLGDDRVVRVRAVVRLGVVGADGPAYGVLRWQQGMESR